jgi:hypothetical protein
MLKESKMQNLSQEDQAVLSHCIVDPQAWIDNAIANNLEFAIQEKINKYRQEYFDVKYISIGISDDTGEEEYIENPDYLNRAERDALEELKRDPLYGKTPEEIIEINKQKALANLAISQKAIQEAGMTCSNGIKLQVDEFSLNRWSQLMAGILAFQPPTVSIIDYYNDTHILPTSEVNNMLSEVFSYIQEFIIDTRTKKNLIINLT